MLAQAPQDERGRPVNHGYLHFTGRQEPLVKIERGPELPL